METVPYPGGPPTSAIVNLLGAIVGLLTIIVMVMSFLLPYWRGQARYVQLLAVIQFFAWVMTQVLESPPVFNGVPVYLSLSVLMCCVAMMNMYDNVKRWKVALFLTALTGAAIDMTITANGQTGLSPKMYYAYATVNNVAYYILLALIAYGAFEKTIWRIGRKHGWIKPVPSAFASSRTKIDWNKK